MGFLGREKSAVQKKTRVDAGLLNNKTLNYGNY